MRMVVAALLGCLPAIAIAQAPPPPIPSPPELAQPIDGYDMRTPHQLWRWWVEAEKGPVTEALLATPDTIDGLKPAGMVMSFARGGDFGIYLRGEVRTYCRMGANGYTPVPGTCLHRLRRAYVPMAAASYQGTNPVAEWTRTHFNAAALARHFKAIGLPPETDWWRADREKMFAAAPSPRAVLTEHATMVRLDSTECPAMAKAIEALEGQSIDTRIDLSGVGEDATMEAPRPHAAITEVTLYLRDTMGLLRLEGSGGVTARLVQPITDAADACEKARKG